MAAISRFAILLSRCSIRRRLRPVSPPREGSKPGRAKTPEGGLARESPVRRSRARHDPSRLILLR